MSNLTIPNTNFVLTEFSTFPIVIPLQDFLRKNQIEFNENDYFIVQHTQGKDNERICIYIKKADYNLAH